MTSLRLAALGLVLCASEAMAQDKPTAKPVPEQTTIQRSAPVWRCDLTTDDGCLLTLTTGETVVGFPVRVVPNSMAELRLISGVRRIYVWNQIKEGRPIPAAQLPVARAAVIPSSNPASPRPLPQDDEQEREIPVSIKGMKPDMKIERLLRSQDDDAPERWLVRCVGTCQKTSIRPGAKYRVIQADGLEEGFSARPWTERLEVSVRPGRRPWYRSGIGLVSAGPPLVLAGVISAVFGSFSSCPHNCVGQITEGHLASILFFSVGVPMTIGGAYLTAKGSLDVDVHDPTPVPRNQDDD